MKERSEFDMNLAIRTWRENLSQSPQFRVENLDELETHLRDSIATMQGQRLTDEEVFLVATRRVGSAAALESEFSKVNAREVWLDQGLWILLGVQLFWIMQAVCRMAEIAVTFGLRSVGYQFSSASYGFHAALLIVGQVMMIAGITAALYWLVRCRPGWLSPVGRARTVGIISALSVTMLLGGRWIGPAAFFKNLSLNDLGNINSAMMWSGLVIFLAQVIGLPLLAVICARRRFRLRRPRFV